MRVIAHRGASGYAPENTRAAFDRAIAMHSDAIETDVQITRDGHLVLIHDTSVERTSDGHGPVADFTWDELHALDCGSWFAPEYAGERVLSVADALDTYAARIPLVLEIKDPRATAALCTLLAARGTLDGIEITSFFWGPLVDVQALLPGVPLAFLTRDFSEPMIERVARRGFAQLCPMVDKLTAHRVAYAHDRGLLVRGWGISQRWEIERLRETHADGATVNWPDWMTE